MIQNREEFKQYCLRSLGAPVVKVDVTEEQIDDRIDEAIDFWQQYNNEGTIKTFLKQRVTPSILHVQEFIKDRIPAGTKIIGVDSKAMAEAVVAKDGTQSQHCEIHCQHIFGEFTPGEKLNVGGKWEFTLVANPRAVEKGIIDEHRIKIPDYILGITRIFPIYGMNLLGSSSKDILEFQMQFTISSMIDLLNTDIINYTMMMQHYDLLQFQINAKADFNFNRHEGYIYPLVNWENDVNVGMYFVFDAYRAVDPNQSYKAWNDRWLKRYAIQLIKLNWATNLKKYSGLQLAGGVTVNGDQMYQEAKQDIQELENELYNNLPPSCFAIG